MGPLEAIAYAIARGFARAWLDVQAERQKATEESPTDEDRARADRLRAAVAAVAADAGGVRPAVAGDP